MACELGHPKNESPPTGSLVRFTENSYPETIGKFGIVVGIVTKTSRHDNSTFYMVEIICNCKSFFVDTAWKQSLFYEVVDAKRW